MEADAAIYSYILEFFLSLYFNQFQLTFLNPGINQFNTFFTSYIFKLSFPKTLTNTPIHPAGPLFKTRIYIFVENVVKEDPVSFREQCAGPFRGPPHWGRGKSQDSGGDLGEPGTCLTSPPAPEHLSSRATRSSPNLDTPEWSSAS